jgi:hypothetical protein
VGKKATLPENVHLLVKKLAQNATNVANRDIFQESVHPVEILIHVLVTNVVVAAIFHEIVGTT